MTADQAEAEKVKVVVAAEEKDVKAMQVQTQVRLMQCNLVAAITAFYMWSTACRGIGLLAATSHCILVDANLESLRSPIWLPAVTC